LGTRGISQGRVLETVYQGTGNKTESPERTSGAPELRAG
jgi:hypothetical protein